MNDGVGSEIINARGHSAATSVCLLTHSGPLGVLLWLE